MPDLRIAHEMPCDEETYWERCFLDAEYNRRLFFDELHFPRYHVTRDERTPASVVRRVEVEPRTAEMPAAVKKLIGDSLGYVEEGTFDRATRRYTFRISTVALRDKTRIEGVFHVEKLGDKRILRVVNTQISVKLFGLGGILEERIVADTRASYDAAAAFTARWVAEKGL